MKVKFGAIVTEGRGKLGGHVASRNTFGSYFRTRVTPINRRTSAQQSIRALFGSISQGWRNLSNGLRDSWNSAVTNWVTTDVFGDSQRPTGFSLYQRLNMVRLTNSLPPLETPPAPGPILPITISGVDIVDPYSGVSTLTLTHAGVLTDAPGYLLDIQATPPLSRGIQFVRSEYRKIGNLPMPEFTPDLEQGISLATASPGGLYSQKFGVFEVNQEQMKVFYRIRLIHIESGNTGPWSEDYAVLSFS